MCGFVGYIDGGETQLMEPVLHAMADRIRHRGPDDADYYMDGEISLGFRRLSIIDLEGGRQPILNEDKSKVLMFNGEIYNYQSLREELLKAGHVFTTKTDSEVLLHGFEEYGTDLLNKLRGMFAFIIWDKNTKTLFGARDYFGIKPFYYAKMQGTLMFGSEIKSFVEHPHFKRELNERALEGYLSFQYSPGYETFFKNVYKLPPAHYFFYKDGKMDMQRYWIPEFNAEEDKPLEYWVDEIEKTFDDSVNAHKIADVEVGSFLSSGVDSSYVACSADVDKTFTVGFDNGEKYNEISYAKELSELIPVKNYSKTITPEEFWGNFGKIQYHMDEPLADPSAVALYFVCNTASKYLKVVMSGEGADEIFGGYNIYKEPLAVPAYDKIPFPIRRFIGKIASHLPKKSGINFLIRRGKKLEDRFIGNAYMFTEEERKKLENEQMFEEMKNKLAGLEKEKTVSSYKASFAAQGYPEPLATEAAIAMANGEMDKVFAAQKKFLEQYEKDVKAKVLKDTPKPPAGGKGGEMTKADFLKLDTKAQLEFVKEHPDWQTILK